MVEIASSLHWLGVTVYSGSVIAFALLLQVARRSEKVDFDGALKVFRAWGVGFGLSLGLLIFTGLFLRWAEMGGFTWSMESPEEAAFLYKTVLFVVLWVSNFHLEIWTLEGVRRAQGKGASAEELDGPGGRVANQLSFNALLVVAIGMIANG